MSAPGGGAASRRYSQQTQRDPVAHLKFLTPDAGWTWFVTEGQPDGEDFRFFGFVITVTHLRGPERPSVSAASISPHSPPEDDP